MLGTFPALQLALSRTFVGDKMNLTITPEQFAAAKAKLLRGLPAWYTRLLSVVAAAYQPSTVPEVADVRWSGPRGPGVFRVSEGGLEPPRACAH